MLFIAIPRVSVRAIWNKKIIQCVHKNAVFINFKRCPLWDYGYCIVEGNRRYSPLRIQAPTVASLPDRRPQFHFRQGQQVWVVCKMSIPAWRPRPLIERAPRALSAEANRPASEADLSSRLLGIAATWFSIALHIRNYLQMWLEDSNMWYALVDPGFSQKIQIFLVYMQLSYQKLRICFLLKNFPLKFRSHL